MLDEIEKAHPDVFNVLLQVLEDGRLTDGQGRTVDFTNTVLIMTSNLPGDPADFFRPEFVNRIDEIVRFRQLSEDDLRTIVDIQLARLEGRMAERALDLEVTPAARDWLAKAGYDPDFGAGRSGVCSSGRSRTSWRSPCSRAGTPRARSSRWTSAPALLAQSAAGAEGSAPGLVLR